MEFVPLIKREISLGPSTIEIEKPCSNELMEINVICLVSLIGF